MKAVILLALLPVALGQVGAPIGMPGGYFPKNLTDTEVLNAHNFVSGQLGVYLGGTSLQLIKAESQVVAGVNYKLTYARTHTDGTMDTCQVVLFTQSWTNTRRILQNTCLGTKPVLVGGNQPSSLNDVNTKRAFDFAVDQLNGLSNNYYRMYASEIRNVQKQLVQGTLYKFTVVMAETVCANSNVNYGKDLRACPLRNSNARHECYVEVSDRVWMNPRYTLLNDRTRCRSLVRYLYF